MACLKETISLRAMMITIIIHRILNNINSNIVNILPVVPAAMIVAAVLLMELPDAMVIPVALIEYDGDHIFRSCPLLRLYQLGVGKNGHLTDKIRIVESIWMI